MKRLLTHASLAIAAFGLAAIAATLPTSPPAHSGLSQGQLLGYIADSSQQMANGSGVATLPTAPPAHSGLSQGQLLGYIADNLQTAAARANNTFYAETYGAVADDGIDDRAAIQSALNAAAATSGVVQLGGGEYKVVVVYDSTTTFDSGTKTKMAGHYGLEIPAGVTLAGIGMYATTITSHIGTDNAAVGCLIAPQGFRSAATAYAAGGFVLRDLKLAAASTADADAEICILLSAVHGDGIRCDRVLFGQASAHGIDIDYNRGLTLTDCIFTGPHPLASSGSYIQWDAGACGPASTHLSASAAPNADTRILRCKFSRADTDTSNRDLDLNHGACEIRGLTLDGCQFTGRASADATTIIRVENSGGAAAVTNDVVITNCTFTIPSAVTTLNDYAINCVNGVFTTGEAQRWVIANNIFTGAPIQHIVAGISTSPAAPTAALWRKFSHWQISGNRFITDQANSISGTQSALAVYSLYEANIDGNSVTLTGTNASIAPWVFRLNSTSGTFTNNIIDQTGSAGTAYHVVQDSSGAEAAVQATTIPAWRWLASGNRSRGNVNTHYYFIGSAVAGGTNYAFQFFGNTTEGTGTAYDLTNQDPGGVVAGGQILATSGSVNFVSMATGAEDTQTITVTGCRTSSAATVDLGWSAALEAGIVIKQAWVSAANTVSITARNTTAGTIDPAALTCRVKVTQF